MFKGVYSIGDMCVAKSVDLIVAGGGDAKDVACRVLGCDRAAFSAACPARYTAGVFR